MKKKAIFYIIILLNHSIVLNYICDPVEINPNEYDFSKLTRTNHFTRPKNGYNKRIQAFDYKGYEKLPEQFSNTINGFITDAKCNEMSKIKSDVIFSLIGTIMEKLRSNTRKVGEMESFLNDALYQLEKIPDKDIQNKLKSDIIYAKNELDKINPYKERKERGINSAVSTTVGGIISYAKDISFFSSEIIITIALVSTTISIGEKLWNWYWGYDENIKKAWYEYYKYVGVLIKLNDKMYNYEWVGNNVVLTAISTEENCYQNDLEFRFEKEIEYKNDHDEDDRDEVYEKMAAITCELRKNICTDKQSCINNLKKYTNCKFKERRGEKVICQRFTDDCTLVEKIKYDY